jgi:hypothetical protein
MSSPRVVISVDGGNAQMVLSDLVLRRLMIALISYCRSQATRVDEAIEDGNLAHADRRAKALRVVGNLIEWLGAAGVSVPRDFRIDKSPLPSERGLESETNDR